MSWALRGLPGSEWLIEYESKLNRFFPRSKCLAICQYDSRKFEPSMLLNVLATHPVAVIGTELFDNFYYVPPDEFLFGEPERATLDHWISSLRERARLTEALREQGKVLSSINEVLRTAITHDSDMDVALAFLSVAQELTGSRFGFVGEINADGLYDIVSMSNAGWDECELPREEAIMLISGMEIRGYWGRAMKTGEPVVVNDPASDPDRKGTPDGHPEITAYLGIPLMRAGGIFGLIGLANKPGGYDEHDVNDMEALSVAFAEALMRKRAELEIAKLNEDLATRALELEAYSKEVEAFSYSVSHDLRAPLRSIDGFSLALLEDYAGELDDRGKDYLNRVRAASESMAELIDDVLKLSRVTRADISREPTDVSQMAREISEELVAGEEGRAGEFEIEPGMVARADAKLLRQALWNLMENAWKFTSACEVARIQVGTTQSEKEQAFFVRDNGVGFDMVYAGKLFLPFQRLHNRAEFTGTGIGLATVQRVVRRHGGRVWGEGKPGEGATFCFTVAPAASSESAGGSEEERGSEGEVEHDDS